MLLSPIRPTSIRRFSVPAFLGAVLLTMSASAFAADEISLEPILEKHRRATFAEVSEYVKQYPQAKDADRAFTYLFRAGLLHEMETEALPAAETYLGRERQNPAVAHLAQRVRCMGLADLKDFDEALAAYETILSSANRLSSETAVRFGMALAGRIRSKGEFGASRDVFERMAAKFAYNRRITRLAEAGLAKHDLIGKPAPFQDTNDIDGRPADLESHQGKVVLLDFWATDCQTCITEMPAMKKLYRELHDQGFEVIGVSRDNSVPLVKDFREKLKVPWQLVMDETESGKLSGPYEVVMLPTTVLIDRAGNVVQFDLLGENLLAEIRRLVKQK